MEYLRRHLSSCSFSGIEIDHCDRIIKINYLKFGEVQSFLLFWKGRKLYFAHYFKEAPESPFKVLLSWKAKAFIPGEDLGDLFDLFNEIGRQTEMNQEVESENWKDMGDLLDEEFKQTTFSSQTSSNFLERKKKNIEDDLRKTQQWQKLQKLLDKAEPLDQIYELKIDDQKIKFEGDLNPFERRNLVFQKIKKLKRGELILTERLKSVEESLLGKNKTEVSTPTIPIIKPVWGEEKITNIRPMAKRESNEFRVLTIDGIQFGVGLNSQGNDQLRNSWASKDDIWIHLDGLKSSHVVIKLMQNKILDPHALDLAASIVAYFSHFNDEWIPIIYTNVKNLKGVSGAAGMVIYKKEKHLRCKKINIDQWLKD
ncbi:MAG: NFACT RNA binding domain-containing protein [Bacteriovoracaceae bacterium]